MHRHLATHVATAATCLALAGVLTACGDNDTSVGQDGLPPAAEQVPAGAAPVEGPVEVTATDTTCALSSQAVFAGTNVLAITNTGTQVQEVYVYEGERVVTERPDIAPGESADVTFEVDAGDYVVACKPGQTGDGIRTALSVVESAEPVEAPDAEQVRAVEAYRAFVQEQADALVPLVTRFTAAVKAGDVARAKALYAPSRVPWEAIEPVAESFGDLDPAVDLREADLEPGQTWTGWHRIEKALWVSGSTAGLDAVCDQLVADIRDLQGRVATAELTVTSIGNGAKELLDEVATGKITGEEEAFSHTDLVDFDANVVGAKKAFEVLTPLVRGNDPELVATLTSAFTAVEAALRPYARGAGYVSYDTVTAPQRLELARVVDALAEPLSQLAAAAVGE